MGRNPPGLLNPRHKRPGALNPPRAGTGTVGASAVAYSSDATAVTSLWTGYAGDGAFTSSIVLPQDDTVRLAVSTSPELSAPIYGEPVQSQGGYAKPTINGLQPDTQYHYGIRRGDTIYTALKGQFKTPPAPGPASFRFGFGSCNMGTTSAPFVAMNTADPLFVMHLGDLHYADIAINDPGLYHAQYNGRMSGSLGDLMRSRQFIYTWSDHDYGPDGSDSLSPGAPAALTAYKARVPHPPFAFTNADDPVNYSFVVGRIRFIVPDGRSRRIGNGITWGAEQKAWVLSEITQAKAEGQFVCLCNDLPWFGGEFSSTERADLGNHIAAQAMEGRVFSVCGDAHSIQIDDGTNKQLATVGSARVPTIHASPFNQGNSTKGGPWSHGVFMEGSRQAGYIDVVDTGGDTIDLTFHGYRDNGTPVVTFAFKLSMLGYVMGPLYAITASSTAVDEGQTVTFAVTSNRPNTTVTVNLAGVSAADISGGDLAPQVTLDAAGAGSFTVQMVDDAVTEGVETLTATIGGTSHTVSVTINDTSAGPPPIPGEGLPVIRQYGIGYSNASSEVVSVTLPEPITAGSLLVIAKLGDKGSSAATIPSGAVQALSAAGTGVHGTVHSLRAQGGETVFDFGASLDHRVFIVFETDAASVAQAIADTTSASVSTRGASATVEAAANALAIATWHNDSSSSSNTGASSLFGPEWSVLDAAGITAAYPQRSAAVNAPAWCVAVRDQVSAGPLTAALSYTGDLADENMIMLVTLAK